MSEAVDLERRILALAPKVAEDRKRHMDALEQKSKADAELLVRVLGSIKPAIPAICGKLPDGRAGFLMVPEKPATAVYEDGTLKGTPEDLVRDFSVVTMLDTILKRLEAQRGRVRAAEKAENHALLVRKILMTLRP